MSTAAHSAFAHIKAPTCLDPQQEIIISESFRLCQIYGTRAALSAECAIPAWPEDLDAVEWKDCQGIHYCISRARPFGAKGRMAAFADADWFELRILPARPMSPGQWAIQKKRDELIDCIRAAERSGDHLARLTNAGADSKFQAFKRAILGDQASRGRRGNSLV